MPLIEILGMVDPLAFAGVSSFAQCSSYANQHRKLQLMLDLHLSFL